MQFCDCRQRNEKPEKSWSWVSFIFGLGIIYMLWNETKAPAYNARMGRTKKN